MKKMKEKKVYMKPLSEIVKMEGGPIADITSWNPDQGHGPNMQVIEGDPNSNGKGAKEFTLYDAWNDDWNNSTSDEDPWKY